ncbi:hypothetical protein JXQ70_01870 [bacterium]|nr:hypothetical protein [bacterium]
MSFYRAPWCTSLIVVSVLATVILVGFSVWIVVSEKGPTPWLALLPLAIVALTAPFSIRGYSLEHGFLLIHRLFWSTRLSLTDLQAVRFRPKIMHKSIRLCGNGGLFSITGYFQNKALGRYRAFVTDLDRTVVLSFSKKTVVISPDDPDLFVHTVVAQNPFASKELYTTQNL